MDRLRDKIADGALLKLIEAFLQADVMEGMEKWTPTAGAPQGAMLSPLLSNIYLDPLDHLLSGIDLRSFFLDVPMTCSHIPAKCGLLAFPMANSDVA